MPENFDMSMVSFERVSKRYIPGKDALTNISFELQRGELVFLTGHSGAGKSTLLKLMTMIERPSRGSISIAGHSLARLKGNKKALLRRNIGVVHQNHQLLSDRTVYDNVALPLLISGYRPRDAVRRVRAALDSVGLLGYEARYPLELSGGEQQRVGIARAVVNKPALLLADEPTGNLDPQLSEEIMQLFSRFQQVGVTVLVATHDLGLVKRFGNRRLQLDHGRLFDQAREPVEPLL